MKKTLTILTIFSSSFFLSAQTVSNEILSFSTKGKNIKTVTFIKKKIENNYMYSINAENKFSKEFNKCKWVNNLSQDEFESLVNNMKNIESGAMFENHLFKIINKHDNITVIFNDTKCTSEHKTHYFQKSCNRYLNFKLIPTQIDLVVNNLFMHLENNSIVKK